MARLLAQAARFYGWGHAEMMRMPVRAFFAYTRQIPRLQAEEALLALSIAGAAAGDGKGMKRLASQLQRTAEGKRVVRASEGEFGAEMLAATVPGAQVTPPGELRRKLEERMRLHAEAKRDD